MALEKCGVEIVRYSIRTPPPSAETADADERLKTTVILSPKSWLSLLLAVCGLVLRPWKLAVALSVVIKMAGRSGGLGSLVRHGAYFVEAAWLELDLRRRGVHHLHAHFGTNPAAVALLCRCLGGPSYSFTIHGPDEFDAPMALSLDLKANSAAAIFTISNFGKSQMYRWLPLRSWHKVHVVRCGLDEDFLGGIPDPVPATSTLVAVGRLSRQKGHALLLQAMSHLRAAQPDARLVIVGEGEERAELEQLALDLGIAGHVEFLGALAAPAIKNAIRGSRAFVLGSFAEGLPVVIMEAFALGRPVVSTTVAGIPELVVPGRNGWLVPPGDHVALADAMAQALRLDPIVLTKMGRAGRAAVEESHNMNLIAPVIAKIFAGIIGHPETSKSTKSPSREDHST